MCVELLPLSRLQNSRELVEVGPCLIVIITIIIITIIIIIVRFPLSSSWIALGMPSSPLRTLHWALHPLFCLLRFEVEARITLEDLVCKAHKKKLGAVSTRI
jgi:hypothetical protein